VAGSNAAACSIALKKFGRQERACTALLDLPNPCPWDRFHPFGYLATLGRQMEDQQERGRSIRNRSDRQWQGGPVPRRHAAMRHRQRARRRGPRSPGHHHGSNLSPGNRSWRDAFATVQEVPTSFRPQLTGVSTPATAPMPTRAPRSSIASRPTTRPCSRHRLAWRATPPRCQFPDRRASLTNRRKGAFWILLFCWVISGRSGRIWTCDPLVTNEVSLQCLGRTSH
jgi:hypothetical protein